MNLDSINRRLDKLDALHPVETPRRFIHLIVEADKARRRTRPSPAGARSIPTRPRRASRTILSSLNSIVSPNAKRD